MTWNPVTGCSKVSQGCKHCYAERMAARLYAMGSRRYQLGFKVTIHADLLNAPKSWKRSRVVFVNSMSDLFHEEVPATFIRNVFQTMAECPQHTFQVLTKRSSRLRSMLQKDLPTLPNVWLGVSVEDQSTVGRIHDLAQVPASVRFLSCEPLLGPLSNLPLNGIDWVIVGGESGAKARQMNPSWVESIREQCSAANVAFFFKQWGGVRKHLNGRDLGGRTYDEMPQPRQNLVQIAF